MYNNRRLANCNLLVSTLFYFSDFYVILTIGYGGYENIHIVTSDNPLYFVMRRFAPNDKIQWIIGYIPWPKGMEYITKMNELTILSKIFQTSRIKIWIQTEWIRPVKRRRRPAWFTRSGFIFLWGMFGKFYEESLTSLFLSGNDVNIWVSDGFNGVYYL